MDQIHVELNEELKQLMKTAGMLGFQVGANFTYVPEMCRGNSGIPKSLWPIFTLRGLDAVESVLSTDSMTGDVVVQENGDRKVNVSSGKYRISVCAKGVVTWRNLRNVNGEIISPPEKVTEDSLRLLSPTIISDLCGAIVDQSHLTEEELLGLQ